MTRTSAAAAVLAATLAFGVGYAVRLACAWTGGSTRVVETQVEETPSSTTSARRVDAQTAAATVATAATTKRDAPTGDGRRDLELAQDKADALVDCCAETHRARESARRALWSRLHDLAARSDAKPLDPREVVGVCVVGDRCVVVRSGDDPELERLLDEADRDERAARADVEFELRR